MSATAPLKPGSTIGILGGGQLGRMLALAAAQLGYRCIAYAPDRQSACANVCADYVIGAWDDPSAMATFAKACDVVTWEFENVPVSALAPLEGRLAAPPLALETAQDRLAEKRFVTSLGGQTARHAGVAMRSDLMDALDRIGTPGILKTRRDGYDGKGQWRVRDAREAEGLSLSGGECVYEAMVEFDAEFSVILVRGRDGDIRFWDSPQNRHEDGMLTTSILPPHRRVTEQVNEARELARQVSDAMKYVGVLTCEFFATAQGPVFNEMAPRVHNSGHWTIEAAITSQFENHIRAICGLPLGDTATRHDTIEMQNIVGRAAHQAFDHLADPAAHLHLYGKGTARNGRKMGHVTRVDVSRETS